MIYLWPRVSCTPAYEHFARSVKEEKKIKMANGCLNERPLIWERKSIPARATNTSLNLTYL